MKKLFTLLMLLLLIFALSACSCKHEWTDATCDAPKTCTLCGETEGEPLSHNWIDATCTQYKTCTLCNAKEGALLEHTWEDAENLCFQICAVCGGLGGEEKEHQWEEATCTRPKTCTVCGKSEGSCAPHTSLSAMDTSGEKIRIQCSCGAEEHLTAQELTLRMLQGTWTLKLVEIDGKFYPPEPQTNWQEGTWLEFPSLDEPYGHMVGNSDLGPQFVIPYDLSDFQAGAVRFTSDGSPRPIVQCMAISQSEDTAVQPDLLRVVLGIRDYDPGRMDEKTFLSAALNGYISSLWRYTEDGNYVYAYNPDAE